MENFIPEIALISGIVLLIIEVAILGFSTLFLMFIGFGLISYGALSYFGILPESWEALLLTSAIASIVSGILLWRPLKKLQSSGGERESNTTYHYEFTLKDDCNSEQGPIERYDGVNWEIRSMTPITKGALVKISKEAVGVLWVEAVS